MPKQKTTNYHPKPLENEERYDLSAVGRVKMSARLNLEVDDSIRVLRKVDVLEIIKELIPLKDGHGEIDDIGNILRWSNLRFTFRLKNCKDVQM